MEIDASMYTHVDNWKWFEVKDLDHFLRFFKPIFYALKDTGTQISEEKMFAAFWNKCKKYLDKVGHKNIEVLMNDDNDFRQGAWNYWTKMHQRQEEGLEFMFKAFKACFGIVGNDDRCQLHYGEGYNYSWKKMADCVGGLTSSQEEFKIEKRDSKDYEWSEDKKKLLAEARRRLSNE